MKRLMSVKEAAEYLGVCATTALSFAEEHGFIVKICKRKMIDKLKLDKWLEGEEKCSSM